MAAVKFLHCADMHLDVPFSSIDSGTGKSTVRRLDLKETFSRIIAAAISEKIQIMLISGDLYEHAYAKKATISFINDEFEKIPEVRIFIIPGNHDPYIKNSYYRDFKWAGNVNILNEDNPYVIIEDLQTCVYGIGFKSFTQEKTLVYDMKLMDAAFINILMVHGTVDMDFKQDVYNPMTSENLRKLGMDYIALGHFHNRLARVGGCPGIYNPGSPEPLGFDETGEHGVFIGTIEKEGSSTVDVKFMKMNKRYYEKLEVDISSCNNDEQAALRIEAALKGFETSSGLFYVTLKGFIERGFNINTGHIVSGFSDKVFYMKIRDESSMDFDYEGIMNEPGLKGLYVRKIFAMISKTEDEYEKRQLERALRYGIEALEKGKIEIY